MSQVSEEVSTSQSSLLLVVIDGDWTCQDMREFLAVVQRLYDMHVNLFSFITPPSGSPWIFPYGTPTVQTGRQEIERMQAFAEAIQRSNNQPPLAIAEIKYGSKGDIIFKGVTGEIVQLGQLLIKYIDVFHLWHLNAEKVKQAKIENEREQYELDHKKKLDQYDLINRHLDLMERAAHTGATIELRQQVEAELRTLERLLLEGKVLEIKQLE